MSVSHTVWYIFIDVSEELAASIGRAIAQAISRWLPTAAVRLRTRV
jgi:hypothetical protein